jgi:hypothetical protein
MHLTMSVVPNQEGSEHHEGYIKSRFSPSNLKEWYESDTSTSFVLSDQINDYDNDNGDDNSDSDLSDNTDESSSSDDSIDSDNTDKVKSQNIKIQLDSKRLQQHRSTNWRREVTGRYRKCIISGLDAVECDAAHIVPFKDCVGDNERWASMKANGLLLSKNLHWTFDRFYWSLDPNDILKEHKDRVWLRIVMRNTKKRLTILQYYKAIVEPSAESCSDNDSISFGYVKVFKDNIPFLRIHYESFLSLYNQKSVRHKKPMKLLTTVPAVRILDRKYNNSIHDWVYKSKGNNQCLKDAEWLTAVEGTDRYGEEFATEIKLFEETKDRNDDPDWAPGF